MNKKAFKFHSISALIALIPLFVISLTGSILVFKTEIDALLLPGQAGLESASGVRQSLDHLHDNVVSTFNDYEIGTWELFDNHEQPDAVYIIKRGTFDWYKVFIDQYQNKILSEPVPLDHYITDWLLELHYTFLLGHTGLVVGAICSLIMLFLGITGCIMYGKFWRNFASFRWARGLSLLFSDIHKFIGITASPVLLILGVTGTYWNIAEFVHETVEHTSEHASFVLSERRYSNALSFQALLDESILKVTDLAPSYLVMPYEPGLDITFFGWVPTNNPLLSNYTSGVVFDRQSGEVKSTWDIRNQGFIPKLVDSFRHLHFGTFAGLTSRIIWCLLGAMPIFLGITGFYLWFNRKRKRQRSRKNRARMKLHC